MHAKIKAIQDLLDALAAIDEEESYGGSEMKDQPEAEEVEEALDKPKGVSVAKVEVETEPDEDIKKDFLSMFEPKKPKDSDKKSIRLG